MLQSTYLFVFVLAIFMSVGSNAVPAAAKGDTAGSTAGSDDIAASVICNVIVFVQRLGLPIMTGVILGASKMAIFGKLAWAAIVMLVVFTAIFFGAGKLIQKFAAGIGGNDQHGIGDASKFECKGDGKTRLSGSSQ
ncbi:TrbC/VirB2 family protein [Candidatus Anaplasma sp. TIGMIC]|uniref:TrbC/VirB2 family protein n=1 Tax=Candidatus Anaplasma sp. TIGMIC TaxID=3020713 RepID=UPI00232BA01B|nr:TrbC/VirB2 family protein [Candidatus Anaplasma sp. TIGMIC]MDB1135739.1 TrbC/VirB2 family protein [Candidatus Anaplasma sp. TIGMIC]